MEPTFDIPDSTDWLSTPLTLLAPLESSLRCQVCKDFFDNPVITSCSHTFCSLCIRRCLSTEGKCPTCRSSDQELKLRRNWAVQELVEGFNLARPSLLQLARRPAEGDRVTVDGGGQDAEHPAFKKRKIEQEDGTQTGAGEGIRTRSQRRGVVRQIETPPIEIVDDDIQDDAYIPDDGLVACPVCQRRMKNEAVFRHLDTCTGSRAETRPAAFGSLLTASRRPFQEVTEKPPDRLPHIHYSILKDTVLRKKLKDLGIPNWGSRALLERRHKEWMNLWNANCDSKTPKRKTELLRELDTWERTQGGMSTTTPDPSNSVMRKDFDSAGWSADYNTDFKQLIASARKKNDAEVRSTIPGASQAEPDELSSTLIVEPPTEAQTQIDRCSERLGWSGKGARGADSFEP
ncbi:Postreplication repair E3 ubiquitin-protein ligase rad18 [Aspergillus cavernicola]|uniref:Postreplication repair E3 ubiquitin-protein ligase RAD18 n=1 Tax=Aspergillus cavernicola TaxID=176166 RepID=A0ABR4IN35_9EURO